MWHWCIKKSAQDTINLVLFNLKKKNLQKNFSVKTKRQLHKNTLYLNNTCSANVLRQKPNQDALFSHHVHQLQSFSCGLTINTTLIRISSDSFYSDRSKLGHGISVLPSFQQGNLNECSSLAHLYPVYKQNTNGTEQNKQKWKSTAVFSPKDFNNKTTKWVQIIHHKNR